MVASPITAIDDSLYDTITFTKISVADNITLNCDERSCYSNIPIGKEVMCQSSPGSQTKYPYIMNV